MGDPIYDGAGNTFVCVDHRDEELLYHPFTTDGLLIAEPSSVAHVKMRIINQDGSEAEMCGNGLRCFKRWLDDIERTPTKITVETEAGIQSVRTLGELIEVEMGAARTIGRETYDTGVPHQVEWVPDVSKIEFSAPSGEKNFNVAERTGPRSAKIRTCERGVGETLACGTGAAAVAYSMALTEGWGSYTILPASGIPLYIEVFENRICLRGPARLVTIEGA